MLVTDKFIFVHLPRSGGTFVSEIIRKCFPSVREIGYHLPLSALPREFSALPVLGTIRNPWAFYPSWYFHHLPGDRYLPLFCALSDNRKLDLISTVRNALNLGVGGETLDFLLPQLEQDFNYTQRHVSNLTRSEMAKIRGSGTGLYTFRFHQLFGNAENIFFCRVESLRSDLSAFFEKIGVATDELRDCVLDLDKKNTSDHRHYATYYTRELAELVSIRDRPLIDRFGFTFEDPPQEDTARP